MKSILFVPATRPDLFEKAAGGPAAAVCIDIEDGVAPDRKQAGRKQLSGAVSMMAKAGKHVAVRINADIGEISHDLDALPDGIDYIVLPMTGSRHQLRQLSDWADLRYGDQGPKIIAMVEEPGGLNAVVNGPGPIARRLTHVALGTEDYAAGIGCPAGADAVISAFHVLGRFAAEWGLGLLGYPGSIAEFKDLDRFRSHAEMGRDGGAVGGFAIHPKQVEVLNAVFGVDQAALDEAQAVVDAFEKALTEGRGAIQLDGKMIDRPVYQAALRRLGRR